MGNGREKIHWVRDASTIEAMASPVRQNIMDRMEAMGPCSVKELAESLDMAPDSLYYHIKRLVAAGMLVENGSRKSARRDEALYDLYARRWHIAYDLDDADNVRAVRKVTAGMLRQAERDFEIGTSNPEAAVKGPLRNLWSLRLEARLTRDEIRAINQHLQAIVTILRKGKRSKTGQLCAISWVLAPLQAHRRRREKSRRARSSAARVAADAGPEIATEQAATAGHRDTKSR